MRAVTASPGARLKRRASARRRSPTAPLIPVVFRVQYNTRLGQEILLVGSSPHLGEWSVANACTLRWTEGGVWTSTLSLPAGARRGGGAARAAAREGKRPFGPVFCLPGCNRQARPRSALSGARPGAQAASSSTSSSCARTAT